MKYEHKDYESMSHVELEDELSTIKYEAETCQEELESYRVSEKRLEAIQSYLEDLRNAMIRIEDYIPDDLYSDFEETQEAVWSAQDADYALDESL